MLSAYHFLVALGEICVDEIDGILHGSADDRAAPQG